VDAKTDEADVGKIKVGALTTFRVDSFPRETFHGRVIQVRMNATTVQNVVTYDTIIEFDNPEQKLFPGMTAYVTIPVAWASDVVKIPNGALRFKPEISEEERKGLFAKYGITEQKPAGRGPAAGARGVEGSRGWGSAASGAPSVGSAGSTAGGAGEDARQSAGAPPSMRQEWGIVWKLLPNKKLQAVQVNLGVTDYTFTEMKEGQLKPGDELAIGQSSGQSSMSQQPARGGPYTGPGGMPRRM
jgi:HlyD family secretion protein